MESDVVAATITNIPRASSGTLVVIDQGGTAYQQQYYIPNTGAQLIYARNNDHGTWTSWGNLSGVILISQSKTTSGGGNFSHELPRNSIVVSCWCNLSDTVVIPYPTGNTTGTTGTKYWWFHVQGVSGSAVASQTITAVIAYMPLN